MLYNAIGSLSKSQQKPIKMINSRTYMQLIGIAPFIMMVCLMVLLLLASQ